MTKYVKIVKDPKDGKEYVVIVDEKPAQVSTIVDEKAVQASEKDASHLVVITSRNSVILREREGRGKTDKNHTHSGFRDERISTFKGPDAPVHAVRYLIEKFNLTTPQLWRNP